MKIIRPIRMSDLDALMLMARTAGAGFTSLPPVAEFLQRKIERSLQSFEAVTDSNAPQDRHGRYMFVMEDTDSSEVGGCCAIEAACGLEEPFYNYSVGLTVHASRELNIYNRHPTLYLSNDYTGSSVLCSLYLRPEFRDGNSGRLLSKSRFLFMASQLPHFAEKIIAEMRGVSNEQGRSPFWEGLGRHFFSLEYGEAEHIVGMGNKAIIAELMPKHPIYSVLLPPEAQAVMGKVHPQTAPALRLLEQEGFRYQGYIDIFDGGPTVEAPLSDIRSVRESRLLQARPGATGDAANSKTRYLISNTQLLNFRCGVAELSAGADTVEIPPDLARALLVKTGDPVRIVAL